MLADLLNLGLDVVRESLTADEGDREALSASGCAGHKLANNAVSCIHVQPPALFKFAMK